MDLIFILIVAVVGIGISLAANAKELCLFLTAWLCVPIGLLLNIVIGSYVAKIGNCSPIAQGAVECAVYGYDVSGWMNSLPLAGYAMAFVGIPWFAVGAIIFIIYLILWFIKTWKKI